MSQRRRKYGRRTFYYKIWNFISPMHFVESPFNKMFALTSESEIDGKFRNSEQVKSRFIRALTETWSLCRPLFLYFCREKVAYEVF
jgi:hypothetical protein